MFAFALQFLQAMSTLWVLIKQAYMNIYHALELFLKKTLVNTKSNFGLLNIFERKFLQLCKKSIED